MKFLAFIFVFVCLVQLSLQNPKFEGDCSKFGPELMPPPDVCFQVKCESDDMTFNHCPMVYIDCRKKGGIGAHVEDRTAVWPDCCTKPVCVDDM